MTLEVDLLLPHRRAHMCTCARGRERSRAQTLTHTEKSANKN